MDIALTFNGCHRRGGVERSVWELARYLSEAHQVTVYACQIDGAGLEKVRQVVLTSPRSGPLSPVELRSRFKQALRSSDHDHVVSFGNDGYGADVQWVNSVHRAWLRASLRYPGSAGLSRYPALRYASPRHLARLGIERTYFTDSSKPHVVVVADAVGEDLGRLYGVPTDRTTVIHNGYSPDEFSLARRMSLRDEVRREYGYADDDVVMVMAANELGRKGLPTVLEAQALLKEPRLKLLVVGRAPFSEAYVHQIESLGLTARVRHGGSHADMGRVHAAGDLFVLPTQYEAFCLAIIEALASGLPVITTDVPGANDRIEDGVNGRLLHDPQSPTELKAILAEALSSSRRADWSDAAVRSVADLTWSRIAARAETLLASLPSMRNDRVLDRR